MDRTISSEDIFRLRRRELRVEEKIHPDELSRIETYLEDPTKQGIWYFRADWKENSGITEDVWGNIRKKVVPELKRIRSSNDQNMELYQITSEEMKSQISMRVSFIFRMFAAMSYKEKVHKKTFDGSFLASLGEDARFIKKIDLEKMRAKYEEAYEIYNNEIVCEKFVPGMAHGYRCNIKPGCFYGLVFPRDENRLELVSTTSEPLRIMASFLGKIGKITRPSIHRVHSPEDEVLAPYFIFLKDVCGDILHKEAVVEQVEKSIDLYNEKKYNYCVSTLGILGESYLIQIYETILRKSCPKHFTMGQIRQQINMRLRHEFRVEPRQEPVATPIYEKIELIIERIPDEYDSGELKESLIVIRDLLNYARDLGIYFNDIISRSDRKDDQLILWPARIDDNIDELLTYRNATSHHSRGTIGNFEAEKSCYCLVSLIRWWEKEKDLIDWKQGPREIMEEVIERSKVEL